MDCYFFIIYIFSLLGKSCCFCDDKWEVVANVVYYFRKVFKEKVTDRMVQLL